MYIGYKIFKKFTEVNASEELTRDNRAVGMVVLGIFVVTGALGRRWETLTRLPKWWTPSFHEEEADQCAL